MRNEVEIIHSTGVLDLTNNVRIGKRQQNPHERPIEKRYKKLAAKREPFLSRARLFSEYTIPNLYPVTTDTDVESAGWQSHGARCVSAVTNKLVMTLFPLHTPFARLELTEQARAVLEEKDLDSIEHEASLLNVVKQAMLEHEKISGRVGLSEAMEHLVVSGTTCIYLPKGDDANVINYPLDRFVNRRDKSGNLLELIIEESKAVDTFEPEIQKMIKQRQQTLGKARGQKDDLEEVNVYTRAVLKKGYYYITEEVLGMPLGESQRVSKERMPFIVLRWKSNYGEDYGRSLVELHASDLHVIQFLSEALAKGMILMADVKYLVKAGAVTDVDHLMTSPTGEFVYGNIDDIGVLQLEKYADFKPIAEVLDKYERRVGQAFLLGSQRDAERVTAYEVRKDALQMEQMFGGAYSVLANTLQQPYFKLLLDRVNFSLSSDLVNTVITTGIAALSKMSDADRLMQWTEAMNAAATLPEGIQQRMKWGDYAHHIATQFSLELKWLMSEEDFEKQEAARAQAMQQQQLMEMAGKAAPQLLNDSKE